MTPPLSIHLKDVSDKNKMLTQCIQADQGDEADRADKPDQAKDSMKEAIVPPTTITAKVFQPIHSSEIFHIFLFLTVSRFIYHYSGSQLRSAT